MKILVIAATAAIALAPLSAVAATPVVAQAAPLPDSGAGTERVAANYAAAEHNSGSIADEETTSPWWHWALHYGVFMTAVGLVAWTIGSSSRRAGGTPPIPPRPRVRVALAVQPAPTFPTTAPPGSEVTRRVLAEAAHRCAVPTCRNPTTEIAQIVSEPQRRDNSFENLIALCPCCQRKGIDRRSIRTYKRNLGILNSRYSDFERRLFDQIAETGRRSFVVEAGLEIPLLHAVNDGLLKRVEQSPTTSHHKYEVADAGLDFVSRYVRGEDIS